MSDTSLIAIIVGVVLVVGIIGAVVVVYKRSRQPSAGNRGGFDNPSYGAQPPTINAAYEDPTKLLDDSVNFGRHDSNA